MIRYLGPFIVFLGMASMFFYVLNDEDYDPKRLDSALIDKPAPTFALAQLAAPEKTFSPGDAQGKVWLLNVWASWCVACLQEHPLLMRVARQGEIPLYGLNYKDRPNAATQWLQKHGNPYVLSIDDRRGDVGIDYGVYGVPETFLIDKQGVIRYKHVGPISTKAWQEKILPKIQELNG